MPPLEVVVIGAVPPPVDGRLRDLGVEVTRSDPHPLDPVSRIANKLLGLRTAGDMPTLLVDNDVCVLEDISDLQGRNVRASVASTAHITDAQWAHIALTTGLEPLEREWISLKGETKAVKKQRRPNASRKLYLNAGVVWIRQPVVFERIWAASIAAIARAFADHPLVTYKVLGSDQVGLATAVAEHGGFDPLPWAYNWRARCFRLGLSEKPKLLHLSKLGAPELLPFSQALTMWWDRQVIKRIKRLGRDAATNPWTNAERDRLLDEAVSVRNRVLRLGAEADLDSFVFEA
jgi:hypothetical protein